MSPQQMEGTEQVQQQYSAGRGKGSTISDFRELLAATEEANCERDEVRCRLCSVPAEALQHDPEAL